MLCICLTSQNQDLLGFWPDFPSKACKQFGKKLWHSDHLQCHLVGSVPECSRTKNFSHWSNEHQWIKSSKGCIYLIPQAAIPKIFRCLNSSTGLLCLKCLHWSWCRNAHLAACAPIREPGVVLKTEPSIKTTPSVLKIFLWKSCLGCVITKILLHPCPGLQVRTRATPGAPPVLRRRHVRAERLGEHGPAHLCPLQPGELCKGAAIPGSQQGDQELQQPVSISGGYNSGKF